MIYNIIVGFGSDVGKVFVSADAKCCVSDSIPSSPYSGAQLLLPPGNKILQMTERQQRLTFSIHTSLELLIVNCCTLTSQMAPVSKVLLDTTFWSVIALTCCGYYNPDIQYRSTLTVYSAKVTEPFHHHQQDSNMYRYSLESPQCI